MLVTDQQEQLRALDFIDHRAHLQRNLRTHYGECELIETVAPAAIAAGLRRYFEGDFAALDEIATATSGSELQRRIWAGLREIPAGQTTSYGEFARTLGYDDPRMAIDIGGRQWRESDCDCRPLPPRDRQKWRPQGVCMGSAP